MSVYLGTYPDIGVYERAGATPPETAQVYYVASAGDDDATGLVGAPWATIAKVNSVSLNPGDSVLFNRGDTWTGETLSPSVNGTGGNPITFGAYGTGDKPIFDLGLHKDATGDWTAEGYSGTVSAASPAVTTDDAIVVSGWGNYFDSSFLGIGNIGGSPLESGWRFTNITIPQGSTINSAVITFTGIGNQPVTTCNVKFKGELSATPATFSTYADFAGRTRTTASVDWNNLEAWVNAATYDSPDLKTIIQEIVNLGGWASGNNLVIFCSDNGSSVDATRQPRDVADVVGKATITINYGAGSTTVWYASVGTTLIANAFFDNYSTSGLRKSTKASCTTQGDWFYDADNARVYVYSATNPATYYNGDIILCEKKQGVLVDAYHGVKSYLTFQNINVWHSGFHSFHLDGYTNNIDNVIIENCESYWCGSQGLAWGGNAFQIYGRATNITVRHCYAYQSFDFFSAVESSVEGAIFSNIKIHYNLGYRNRSGFGFFNDKASSSTTGLYVENNTFTDGTDCWSTPIAADTWWINGIATSNTPGEINGIYFRNNIIDRFSYRNIWVDTALGATFVCDYNCYNKPLGGNKFRLGATEYTTIAAWRTATSQDANSMDDDPEFVNVASDFSLQTTSPCKNTGTDVGYDTDYAGNAVPIGGTPDIGAYEYQGTGGVPEINVTDGTDNISVNGTYAFGAKTLNSNTDKIFTIENLGDANLTLSGSPILALTGTNADQFSIQAQPTTPIAASAHVHFTLRFTPTSAGAKVAAIAIGNNDADEATYTINLTGTGTDPEINVKHGVTSMVSGNSYSFGTCTVATNTDITFTIENTGNQLLTLSGSPYIVLAGTDPTEFSVLSQPEGFITAGGSSTFGIRFTPTGLGAKSATIAIASDDLDENPFNITLSGTGGAAPSGGSSPMIYYVDSSITDTNVASATPDFTTYNPVTYSTSTGTASVYKTIADLNACTFAAGDTILFRRGQTWREQLTIPSSGTSGSPITFGAFGSGVGPIINGSDLVTTWTACEPTVVFADGFETNDFSLWTSESDTGGDLSVSNVSPRTGTYAMLDYIDDTTEENVRKTLAATTAEASMVFYVQTPNIAGMTDGAQWNPLSIRHAGGSLGEIYLKRNGVNIQIRSVFMADEYTWTNAWADANYHKIEIKFKISATVGYHKLYIDDVEKRNSTGLNTGTNVCTGLRLGNNFNTASTSTIYYDDVAVTDLVVVPVNQWQATCTTEPQLVYFNGTRGTKEVSQAALDAANEWFWASNILYIYSTSDPDTAYVSPGIEAGKRDFCIDVNSQDYIVIEKLNLVKANAANVLLDGTNQADMNYCISTDGIDGVEVDTAASKVQNCVLYGNTNGVDADAACAVKNCIIRNNTDDLQETGGTVVKTTNNIEDDSDADPLLTSATDFHLLIGSPCINAGTNISLTQDYEDTIVGALPDIGAYEYASGSPPLGLSMGIGM